MDAIHRFSLEGRIAVVTGGVRGIGRGIATALAQHGADVAVVDIADEDLAATTLESIRQHDCQAWYFQQDLADTDAIPGLVAKIWQRTGRVDILVNNAGIGYLERFNEITVSRWREVMAVNAETVFFLTQQIAERMIASTIEGSVINTSSVNGLVAEAGLAHYNASKGAVEMITKSLAIELGPHGINVNSICPGMIDTEIDDAFPLHADFQDYFNGHIPLGNRVGTVEECVGAVVFFASPAAKYITGQNLVIDGGLLCEQAPRMPFMPPYRSTIDDA